MKILIACEESQEVCKAFRAKGHEAYSCDIIPCSGGEEDWHMQCDIFHAIKLRRWDMMIAFPPCTHLAVSGARHFEEKKKDGRQLAAVNFFMDLVECGINKIAIENPIGIMSSIYRKPDQIIQPWMFGHGETKATCLWLKNLPKLQHSPVNTLFYEKTHVEGREQRIWKMPPSETRAKERSKTYPNIAKAMADAWG